MKNPNNEYTALGPFFHSIGMDHGQKSVQQYIKRFNIQVSATVPYGRGNMQLVTKEETERIRALVEESRALRNSTKQVRSKDETVSSTELHLGALETKVDRLCERERGVEDAVNVLIKQANILTERLDKVLKQLGAES